MIRFCSLPQRRLPSRQPPSHPAPHGDWSPPSAYFPSATPSSLAAGPWAERQKALFCRILLGLAIANIAALCLYHEKGKESEGAASLPTQYPYNRQILLGKTIEEERGMGTQLGGRNCGVGGKETLHSFLSLGSGLPPKTCRLVPTFFTFYLSTDISVDPGTERPLHR